MTEEAMYPNRMDYEDFGRKVERLRKRDLAMIISLDLDGILSAMLLQELLDWKVVGFYNFENFWTLADSPNLEEIVFIDHDIYRRNVLSVGHHLLQWDKDTPIPEHQPMTSINPNLLRGHMFDGGKGLKHKYPFGTFHFLLACYHAWGMIESLPTDSEWLFVMMHVDSSLRNAFTYPQNALDWLRWLGSLNKGSPLRPLCDVLTSVSSTDLLRGIAIVKKRIKRMGFPEDSQCSISDPMDPVQWAQFQAVVSWLKELTGWRSTWPHFPSERVKKVQMRRDRCKPTKANFLRVVTKRPFSYALISRAEHGLNYALWPCEEGEV